MFSGNLQQGPKCIQEIDHFLFNPDYILIQWLSFKNQSCHWLSMTSSFVSILLILAKWYFHYPFIGIWFCMSKLELLPFNTHCSVLLLWSNAFFPSVQVPKQITPIMAAGPWSHQTRWSVLYSHLGSKFHARVAWKHTRNRDFISCYRLNCAPYSYVEVLTLRTSESDCIRR